MSSYNTTASSNNNNAFPVPYRSSRWPARWLIWTGVVHNVVGFISPEIGPYFNDAVRAGYVNQFVPDYARCHAFWFYLVGFNFIMMGRAMDWYLFPEDVQEQKKGRAEKKNKSLVRSDKVMPRELGYWFLGIGVAGAAALPESGFYLLIAQGAGLLLAK
ncbi:hypothetical protein BGW39_006268 [Mortierella sp. 14UC]|nr:hypothetical protein BGW39_006268 [Mortierella sp. 14UC]